MNCRGFSGVEGIKRAIRGLVMILAPLFVMPSCIESGRLDDITTRTVLIYIAAENNLSNTAQSNIFSMNSNIRYVDSNTNLVVFVDRMGLRPCLLHIHNAQIDTLKKYDELDSTKPEVLSMVIDDMTNRFDSESYGLVLWSHGTGWIPTDMLHYTAPSLNYAPGRGESRPHWFEEPERTKAFGWETKPNQTPNYTCMEIDDLASAIPDGLFDFIAFDACYMGAVEVAYELRNKADYIIASCYEIVSLGFPYHVMTRDLLSGSLMKICREFYTYYNSMTDWERMAGISLVKTAGLDSLAGCFRKVVSECRDSIPRMDLSKVQCFDRFDNHMVFDLEDAVSHMGASPETLREFRLQLENCVLYKVSTPYIFYNDKDEIKVNTYCGLSVFVPVSKYDAPGVNAAYRRTGWSIATGY